MKKSAIVSMFFLFSFAISLAWSPATNKAMLDTFFAEYDWVNDYGCRKEFGQFPRLYNMYLSCISIMSYGGEQLRYRAARALSKWDVLILQYYWFHRSQFRFQSEMIESIRVYHPDIILLLYFPGGSVPTDSNGYLCQAVFDSLNAINCWIKDTAGNVYHHGSWWPINYFKYPDAVRIMTKFILATLDSFPYFDGVMLDVVYSRKVLANWIYDSPQPIDVNEDGRCDWTQFGSSGVDSVIKWIQTGLCSLISTLRDTLGDSAIIVGNGGYPWFVTRRYPQDSVYWVARANGNMSEEILDEDGLGKWRVHGPRLAIMAAMQNFRYAYANPIHFMGEATIDYWGEDSDPRGHIWRDRRQMRYTLCIALMTDGYYSYDTGGLSLSSHSEIWWFPEYNCNLGYAAGNADTLRDSHGNPYMVRQFTRGIVYLNANFDTSGTGDTVHVVLDTTYLDVSTGDTVSEIYVPQYDGRILLRLDSLKVHEKTKPELPTINVSPNPFNEQCVISIKGITLPNASIEVLTTTGKVVAKFSLGNNQHKVKLSAFNLPSGIYFIRLTGTKATKKILLIK